MSFNPYHSTSANLEEFAEPKPRGLVRAAIYCGIVGGCILYIDLIHDLYLFALELAAAWHTDLATLLRNYRVDAIAIGSIIMPAAMIYGIYRRSRLCAILLFLCSLATWASPLIINKGALRWDWSAVFDIASLLFSLTGVAGTILHHRRKKAS